MKKVADNTILFGNFAARFLLLVSIALSCSRPGSAQTDFNAEPIRYESTESRDAVARLIRKLAQNQAKLEWDEKQGWLPDVLKKLDIDPHSQTLVFSKTSLQIRHISPSNPRALYFNDDVYVGSVPGGDIIEIAAVDDQIGPVFYALKQTAATATEKPLIRRDENQCMTCHGTSKTKNVPGFLVRSVFPSGSGHPHYGMGTLTTDHTTPLKKRFGGWYVTGKHGAMIHRGNLIARRDPRDPFDYEKGANLLQLPQSVRQQNYLVPTSDIVALMVLEQQGQVHNAITRANYETRKALHHQKVMNQALDREPDFQSESTVRRIQGAGDELLAHLLYCEEYELEDPVQGNSKFTANFAKVGPRDRRGRSLREFDLTKRMFKYPCSYLIYSDSYNALPAAVLDYVEKKLLAILTGQLKTREYSHLTAKDRAAILEILADTNKRIGKRYAALQAGGNQ